VYGGGEESRERVEEGEEGEEGCTHQLEHAHGAIGDAHVHQEAVGCGGGGDGTDAVASHQ
jgi:hypothetical protein